MYFEKTFPIASRDIDCFSLCKPSGVLCYLQDAATLAAAAFDADGFKMLERYDHIWMLARLHYTLSEPLHWRDELTIKTWHRGGDKTIMYRDFDLSVGGRKVGEALTSWVLADVKSRTLSRFDRFPEFKGTDGGALIRSTRIPHLRLPKELSFLERRQMHYSDTDLNGHVNNTHYADFMCDALRLAREPQGTYVRELQIAYQKECGWEEVIDLSGGEADGRHYVQGAGPDGDVRFQGYVVW